MATGMSAAEVERALHGLCYELEQGLRSSVPDYYSWVYLHLRYLSGTVEAARIIDCFSIEGCCHCLILAAVADRRVDRLNSIMLRQQSFNKEFMTRVITDLTATERYWCVFKLLEFSDPDLRTWWFTILDRAHDRRVHQALGTGTGSICKEIARDWFLHIVKAGDVRSFELLLTSVYANVLEGVFEACMRKFDMLEQLVYRVNAYQRYVHCDPNDDDVNLTYGRFLNCLKIACEAGLFSSYDYTPAPAERRDGLKEHPLPALREAVHGFSAYSDLVTLLCKFGTRLTHSAIFRLSQSRVLNLRLGNPPDAAVAQEIQGHLITKATQLRSLKDICLRFLTRLLGCGFPRDLAVMALEIPPRLKPALIYGLD